MTMLPYRTIYRRVLKYNYTMTQRNINNYGIHSEISFWLGQTLASSFIVYGNGVYSWRT